LLAKQSSELPEVTVTENKNRLDPRIQRTRKYLLQALMEMVVEKGYQNITITDLAESACINRSTFYLHYQDKDDLLITGFKEYWNQVLPEFQILLPDLAAAEDNLAATLESDLEHFNQKREYYRIMLCEKEIPPFRDCLYDHLFQITQMRLSPLFSRGSSPTSKTNLVLVWMTSAYLGIIRWWLAEEQPSSPSELAAELKRLFFSQLQGFYSTDKISPIMWAQQEQIAGR
jgi:AcrR family transcriptional regulator